MALTDRQRAFVVEYVKCWNASEAARRAGYTGDANTVGPRLLANVGVKAQIDAFKAEHIMSAEEAQIALTEQARSDIGDFLTQDGDAVTVDLPKAIAAKKTGLIKKLSQTRTTRARGEDDTEVTVSTTIELYDKQAALVQVGKVHKLFVERRELTGEDGGPIQTESTQKLDLSKLSTEQLRELRTLLAKAQPDEPAGPR